RARVVEDAGRAPALRAAHDRSVTVLALDAGKLTGDEIERALPWDGHKAFPPAALAPSRPAREVALPHHRLRDPIRRGHRRRHRLEQRGRIGIAGKRLEPDEAPVLDFGEERAPVRMMRDEFGGHGDHLQGGQTADRWYKAFSG